ncbi:amidohydrolase (plasmid) [Diaphorobacter sp. HDW4B]|uniref:M20 aminoacylase family protein n=1 Tax=Diaphorobacter sp. HDW4B TaxID=2714925 RepID=UPI00140ABD59|nr:M20 aminoacylase family protein [Diaphorobacter sp. HDW4B]QIL73918.1 amidohydrolase [Diaphorobacter sp. HDW4B]
MSHIPALRTELDASPLSAYLGPLVALRRDLHAHPELKFEEHRTADRIAAYLKALGVPIHRGLGGTGIVATIAGKGSAFGSSSRAIGIRADMDALPIQEMNVFDHRSQSDGRMHACGHDGHTAMLLGAATLLAQRPEFDGTVHLIFQPGEEGGAGARLMMEEGLFTMFPCEAVFALHNWPALPAGEMGVRVGPIMASANRFEIRVHGRGGHAALPHTTVDPIPVACAIVGQLQSLVSRGTDPLDSAVLTVGKIEAGTIENIIPDEAAIYGTCRTLSPQTLKRMLEGIERVATHVAAAHEARVTILWKPGYPSTCNSHHEARFMGEVMRELVGEKHAHPDVMPAMTAEDFGFMLEQIPGAYGFIGNGANGKPGVTLHSPSYDFNDDNIALGARFWERLVHRWFATSHKETP